MLPVVSWTRRHDRAAVAIALVAICLFGFVLRVWNLNWDEGTHQHPDERFWSIVTDDIAAPAHPFDYLDSASSPLNPYNRGHDTFVYGTLPLFVTKAVASYLHDGPPPAGAVVAALDGLGIDLRDESGADRFDAGYNANLIGRLLSALVDTATIGVVYLLASTLFDRRVGLVAALLQASTVLHIQYSHFHGGETWVALFTTLAVLGSVHLARRPGTRVAMGTGVALGMAMASKFTALAALAVPALALLVWLAPDVRSLSVAAARRVRYGRTDDAVRSAAAVWRRARAALGSGMWLVATAAVTFRILQPYAFDGLGLDERFRADLDYITGVNSGERAVPWTIQWIGVTPLVHPLVTAFRWGLGPPLGVAVALGLGWAVVDIVRRRRFELLVPLALLILLVGLVSRQFNPLIRYLLPGYPVAVVFGAYGVVRLWDRFAVRRALRVIPAALVGLTVLYALAFTNGVYGQEHPRLAASRWIAEHVPPGSALSAQVWDDQLPLRLPDVDPDRFAYVALDPFFPDNASREVNDDTGGGVVVVSKVDALVAGLDRVDYVVEASNKLYGAIPRFPAKYPATTAYYEALFDGRLGFEQVAEFTNSPSLFGLRLDTSGAEETFTVYDHPTVTIWRKTDAYTTELARAIINGDAARVAVDLAPGDASTNALLLTPADAQRHQRGGTWNEVFDPDGPTSAVPWLWWFVWLQVAAMAAVPWVTWLFARMPDQGYPLTKLLGVLAVAAPVWAIVSWGVADFSARLVWTWSAVVVAGGVALGVRRRRQLRSALRRYWRVWAGAEALFTTAFLAVLALRAANPDLWHPWYGGEKPMELAYLTAITRSTSLPAFDPWFGGGAMNYYYGGWFVLAVPIRALQMVPEVAFNLGLATFAALSATVAYSTVANLVVLGRRRRRSATLAHTTTRVSSDEEQDRSWVPVGAGLLGAGLLLAAGNLDAVRIQADRMWTSFTGGTAPAYDWWAPSRVNHGLFDITEFPYWSILYGDLHPHLMGIAVLGLVVAVALAHVVSARAGDTRRSLVFAAALGLVTGLVRIVHTWDLPVALVVAAGALAIGQLLAPDRPLPAGLLAGRDARPVSALGATVLIGAGVSGGLPPDLVGLVLTATGAALAVALVAPASWRPRTVRLVGHVLVAGLCHIVVFWPYLRTSEVYDSGLQAAPVTTALSGFLWHWTVLAVPVVALLVLGVARWLRALPPGSDRLALVGSARGMAAGALVMGAVAVAAMTGGAVTVVCAVGVAVAALVLLAELARPDRTDLSLVFPVGLAGLGLGMIGGVDVVTVINDIERMNTVFKFWYAAWHLLALAAAYAVWRVSVELADAVRAAAGDAAATRCRRRIRNTWRWGISALLMASLTFPLVATGPRLDQRFADTGFTLDGLAYLRTGPTLSADQHTIRLAEDLPLIDWLRTNVNGTPVIAEATGPLYDWTSRISVHTGLPTVIGWDHHQRQQRRGVSHLVDQRVADTRAFFTIADREIARSYLRRYGVSYVVVGTMERRTGSVDALGAFDDYDFLEPVFRNGDSAVYAVVPQRLVPLPTR